MEVCRQLANCGVKRSGRAGDLRGSLRARYGDKAGGAHLVRALEGRSGGAGALASRAAALYTTGARCPADATPTRPPRTTAQHTFITRPKAH